MTYIKDILNITKVRIKTMRKSDLINEALDEFVNQYQTRIKYHNVIYDDYDEAGDCIGISIRIINVDDNSYFVDATVDGDDIYIDISEDN